MVFLLHKKRGLLEAAICILQVAASFFAKGEIIFRHVKTPHPDKQI